MKDRTPRRACQGALTSDYCEGLAESIPASSPDTQPLYTADDVRTAIALGGHGDSHDRQILASEAQQCRNELATLDPDGTLERSRPERGYLSTLAEQAALTDSDPDLHDRLWRFEDLRRRLSAVQSASAAASATQRRQRLHSPQRARAPRRARMRVRRGRRPVRRSRAPGSGSGSGDPDPEPSRRCTTRPGRAPLAGLLCAAGAVLAVHGAQAESFALAVGNTQTIECAPASRVVRVLIPQYLPADVYRRCAWHAKATGHRVFLVVQYRNCWTTRRVAQRVRTVMRAYPKAWAVAFGNEQDFPNQGGEGCPGSVPPAAQLASRYARLWPRFRRIVTRSDPGAILVAGETGPWGYAFTEFALADGLPGVQAIAAHPYPNVLGYRVRAFITLAHRYHVAAWADEGMCGRSAWAVFGCTTAATLRRQGYALGGEWFVPAAPVTIGALP